LLFKLSVFAFLKILFVEYCNWYPFIFLTFFQVTINAFFFDFTLVIFVLGIVSLSCAALVTVSTPSSTDNYLFD
jgi:hypothetical protein